MSRGLFITFEGGEGVGKTSVIKAVVEKLAAYDPLSTREPGGVDIAEQIRDVILNPQNTKMDGIVEALLYASCRRQHLVEKIIPALTDKRLVLCDRYVDSSIVYQGYARGLGMDVVREINEFATDQLMPDLTFFFDIMPEQAFARLHNRELNRLDLEDLSFHNKVYEGYKKIIDEERFVVIDATKPLVEVVDEVCKKIEMKLGEDRE